MPDRYASLSPSLSGPLSHAFSIAPSDSVDLSETTRALYVGGDGDLSLIMASGAAIVLAGVSAGTVLPLRITRVMATATTATALAGLV
jgi:hypothetical protein